MIKASIRPLLHPCRGLITWACQRGFLPSKVKRFLPWRWALEPFTIYGHDWKCRWFPTEFDAIAHRIFWSGLREWEKETAPVILKHIRQSRRFIDVGANCGIYSVLGATVNPRVRVVAIEPVKKLYAALLRNVSENDLDSRVMALNVAAGKSNELVSFHEAVDSTMSSLNVQGYKGQSGQIIPVQCRTLDSIVEELKLDPDFIKIDVEGYEDEALIGAVKRLDQFRPRIVLEANPGDPASAVFHILTNKKYRFYLITDSGPELREEIIPSETYRNWLCVPCPARAF